MDDGKDEEGAPDEDIFLQQFEGAMLNSASMCSVKGVNRDFLTEQSKTTITTEGTIRSGQERESGRWRRMASI